MTSAIQVIFMSNKKTNLNTIGGRLKEARENKGYTQEKVAELLCISNRTYSKYECVEGRNIPVETLIKLSSILDISIDVLLTGKFFPAANDLKMDYAHLLYNKSDAEKAAGLKLLSAFFEGVASCRARE